MRDCVDTLDAPSIHSSLCETKMINQLIIRSSGNAWFGEKRRRHGCRVRAPYARRAAAVALCLGATPWAVRARVGGAVRRKKSREERGKGT